MTKHYKIQSNGQVTLPSKLRDKLELKPGDEIFWEETQFGWILHAVKKNNHNHSS